MARPKLLPNEETIASSVRLPLPLREKLYKRASENRRSLNQELVWLVQKAMDLLEKEPDKLS